MKTGTAVWFAASLSALCVTATQLQFPFALRDSSATGFSRIVVFGDSLVDNGNGTYLFTNKTWPSDPAYMNGRFSNGETWPEQLASLMQVPHVDDFAYGGATTNSSVAQGLSGYNESIAVPDVRAQLHEYMDSVDGKVDRNALYILSGGSNDVYYGTKETLNIWRLGNQCAATLKRLAQYLIDLGATTIMIPTLVDGSKVPSTTQYSYVIDQVGGAAYIKHFNTKLEDAVQELQSQNNQKARIVLVDLYERGREILADPEQFGIKNTEDACLVGTTKVEKQKGVARHVCSDPNSYFYWDIFHPTAHTHQLLAQTAQQVLQERG